jgi:hypothetical protein
VSGKRITTHIHNLDPFIYDPIRTNPLTVAQHNEQEFMRRPQSTIHLDVSLSLVWIRQFKRQLGTIQDPASQQDEEAHPKGTQVATENLFQDFPGLFPSGF